MVLSNRVKPAVFDLFLAFGIGLYAFMWYLSILVSTVGTRQQRRTKMHHQDSTQTPEKLGQPPFRDNNTH